jgi:hypothetical protein
MERPPPYRRLPVNAPFPTAWSFPFHPSAGIQTSTLMSESLEGVSVAATRQNAGSAAYCRACPSDSDRPGGIGGVNAPAATTSAVVIVPSGSNSDARLSHAAGDPPAAVSSDAAGVTALLQAAPAASNTARLNVMVVERR